MEQRKCKKCKAAPSNCQAPFYGPVCWNCLDDIQEKRNDKILDMAFKFYLSSWKSGGQGGMTIEGCLVDAERFIAEHERLMGQPSNGAQETARYHNEVAQLKIKNDDLRAARLKGWWLT